MEAATGKMNTIGKRFRRAWRCHFRCHFAPIIPRIGPSRLRQFVANRLEIRELAGIRSLNQGA